MALKRPLLGFVSILTVAAIVAVAVTMFRGGFSGGVPVTVLSPRAGLVMNSDAKVTLLGAQVGKVESIEERPDGQAALHLSIDPAKLHIIPANVRVNLASPTVFGNKYVQLVVPADPSPAVVRPGQVLEADHVTVEINTIFEQLVSVLSKVEPTQLNETLGAISRAFSGRGDRTGRGLADFNAVLAKIDPAMPHLSHLLSTTPGVLDTYADTAPDLLQIIGNSGRISHTVVDEAHNLDAFLLSTIGLADVGNTFLSTNGAPLTNLMRLLTPTTALTDEYNPALTCGLNGMLDLANVAEAMPASSAGLPITVNFVWGHERYRYPGDLPKVGAKGGPQCEVLPVKYQAKPPYIVTDTGTNPFRYGNQGWLLNSDGLKQLLFGPIDGPPRNTAQIGQPG